LGKSRRTFWGTAAEGEGVVGGHHEVDLAALEQIAELGAGRRLGETNVRRQLAAEAIGAALHPFDVARLDAIFVLQQAAHVDRRRHGVFGDTAALALEIGRRLDPLVGVDEEVAVAEDPRRKGRLVMRSEAPEGRTAPKCKAKPRHFGQERHSRLGLQATCHQHGRSFRQARKIAIMCLKFGVHPGNPGLTVFLGAPAGVFGPIANARQHAYCRLG
jgi:hypothetical protein